MKKLLSLLAILMMVVVGKANAEDETVWTEVSTAEQFYSVIKNDHSANVKLTADIDLSGHKASDDCIFNFGFSGKIDGGYTDSNGNELSHKLMNSKNDLLFNYLENAEISNLTIYNCKFDGWDTHSGWLGTEAKYCTFTDIEILNCNGHGDSDLFDNDDIGGLVGVSKHCTLTRVYSINSSIETDGERAGLIVGKDEYSTFIDCVTGPTSSIWADGNSTVGIDGNAYCGGICGDATGSTFNDCINMALVCSKDDRTGGIIGFGSGTKLNNCINSGIVCNAEKSAYNTVKSTLAANITTYTGLGSAGLGTVATGIALGLWHLVDVGAVTVSKTVLQNLAIFVMGKTGVAQAWAVPGKHIVWHAKYFVLEWGVEIALVVAVVAATALTSYAAYHTFYKADEIGGIAGKLDNGSEADRCTNLGGVECEDKECGGIVGYLDGSTVKNCLNRGMVKGEDRTGGIAGYCNNNSVLNGNINISGFNALGGKGGYIYDVDDHGDVTVTNNYYVYNGTAHIDEGCIGETPENFATGSVALKLNKAADDTIWHQNLGKAMYPILQANVPPVQRLTNIPVTAEKIACAGEFIIAISNPYAVVSLEADIDMSGVQCVNLSSEDTPFHGKIYGNGHKIYNFSYQVPYCSTDHKDSNAGIFPFAQGAEFHNFTIENFHFTQKELPTIIVDEEHQQIEALLVAQSTNCIYDSIAIKNSTIYKKNRQRKIAGIAAVSNYDTFTNCSVDKQCRFEALTGDDMNDALVAGIAAVAKGSKFSYCSSATSLWSDDNKAAAIVGELKDGSIDHCFSAGNINSHERVAGIAGYAENTPITYCVNVGIIQDGKDTRQDWRGGIVGQLTGSSAYKAYNLNFGTLNYMASKCEAIGKLDDGAVDGGNNYYYCQYNGDHSDNESSFTEEKDSIYRYAKMLSGEFAYKAVDADGKQWVYQDIDNNSFGSHLPTPIPAAGKVYSNILCDGTESYSNRYQSTGGHTATRDQYGFCSICGKKIGEPNTEIHIKDSLELIEMAYMVNKGADLTGSTVYLDNDINLMGCDFPIIGRYYTAPFMGTFDGQGHRIKNMTLNFAEGGIGLFGVVSGTSTIKNVIIDSSCSITSTTGYGVAGLVGSTKPFNGVASNVTIENCGNEATVTGVYNAAGILGGVFENDANTTTIRNCYNIGTINGNSESAAICGYVRKNYTIVNCYNCGTLSGGSSDQCFYRYNTGGTTSVSNCYDVNGSQTGVTHISLFPVESGKLCQLLNKDGNVFTQTVKSDSITYPVLGTAGLSGDPDSYWKEVSTAAEFKEAIDMTNINSSYPARIRLTADIDLSNLSPISSGDEQGYLSNTNYGGTIDGNGHTLSSSVYPLFYRTSQATIKDLTLNGFNVVNKTSAIARTSYATNFTNITVEESSITASSSNNFGFIVGYSNSDNISYCTVESDCHITANRQRIGGIVGEMFGGKISYCRNSATITADADDVGGIVGKSGDSDEGDAAAIEYCLNTGTINGDDQCGGIVGYYRKGTITNCVNTGTITSKDGDNHDNQGGIAGKISNANCNNSINFGSVVKANSQNKQFAIYGGKDGDWSASGNEYYCDVKGKHFDTGMSYDNIMSGAYALSKDWLYQDIDNGTFTSTAYPVPLPKAGTVYSNILCDGTQSYSNTYKSTGAHTSELDMQNYCTICGNYAGTGNLHIKTAALLYEFANAVNSGRDYSGSTIYLDNDIDMSGISGFTPIGTLEHPYIGTFNGQGHRIMNLAVSRTENYAGLFGCVAGDSTVIKNVIIDSSCSVTTTASAAGGLVGGAWSTNGSECKVIIENCGNEGKVSSGADAGGVIGGIYANDDAVLVITNSYNSGAVKSTNKQGATLCGYARKNYTFTNCYNSGTIDGYEDSSKPFFRFNTGGTTAVVNCYDVYVGQTGVTKVTADQVASGELCSMLNKDTVVFTQVAGTDTITHPVPGTAGLIVSSAVHITSASELTKWANYVNLGVDYSNSTIYLDNDIDMSGVTDYAPIGTPNKPFRGTFDGQGHSIKNLTVSQNKQYTGFFGCVAGNGTVIKNVTIDSSCSIASTGTSSDTGAAVAGLVGGVNSAKGTECNVTIENCGNEADVTGYSNVAGILGGSYRNDKNVIIITHCYNTGAVTGTAESASICGYTRKNYTITNCYNSGALTGGTSEQSFYRYNTGGSASVDSCYDVNGSQTGVTQITAAKVASGELCFLLNGNKAAGVWGHTCDDTHPVLSGAGMQHYSRTMASQWGTICLPFAINYSGKDYDLYELSGVSSDVLTLKKVTELAAGKPAIVYRSLSATGIDMSAVNTTFVDAPVTGSSANGLTLTGTFTSENISGKKGYFISNNAFWNISGSSNLYCDPFRAYLAGTLSNGAKMLTIGFDNDAATALDALDAMAEGEAEYYDLSGHKLNNLQKGVNVVRFSNGVTKKIIIK